MTIAKKPSSDSKPLVQASAKLLDEKVLSKGGKMPSPTAFKAATKLLAHRAASK